MVAAHGMWILGHRTILLADDRQRIIRRLTEDDKLAQRNAANILAIHPSDSAFHRHLLKVRPRDDTARDPYLLHAVRIALRDQIVLALRYADVKWTAVQPSEYRFVADAALGARDLQVAEKIAEWIPTLATDTPERMPEYLLFVARYAPPASLSGTFPTFQTLAQRDPKRGMGLYFSCSRAARRNAMRRFVREFAEWASGACTNSHTIRIDGRRPAGNRNRRAVAWNHRCSGYLSGDRTESNSP